MDIIHDADEEKMKWKTFHLNTFLTTPGCVPAATNARKAMVKLCILITSWSIRSGLPAWDNQDNKVILVKQYRHAAEMVCTEIPGGCIDAADPNPEAAIRREFIEETGYTFDKVTYLGRTSPNPSTNSNWMHMFLLTGGKLTHPQSFDENEEIEVMLVTLEEFATWC